jgi:hypothetical protein
MRCPNDEYYMQMILTQLDTKQFRLNGYKCPKCGMEILT